MSRPRNWAEAKGRVAVASLLLGACGVDDRAFGEEVDMLQGSAGTSSAVPDPVETGSGEMTVPSAGAPKADSITRPSEPSGPTCPPGGLGCSCAEGSSCEAGLGCDRDVCRAPGCGNARADGVEECDDGNTVDTDACTSACENARCGDGFVQGGIEACDDGNVVDTDTCTSVCQNARCGDGFVQGIEACDDANIVDTDACTSACQNARCGDGFIQGTEACDDGNVDDADSCSNQCVSRFNTMFITSTTYTVPDLGGVAGADAFCRERAAAGGLAGDFVAWISDTSSSVLSRLGAARGWLRPDGLPFTDRIDGTAVFYPPSVTELGTTVTDVIAGLGGYTEASGSECSDWTTFDQTEFFMPGDPTGGYGAWNGAFGGLACNANFRLYCLQRDFSSRLVVSRAEGRQAFVSDTTWAPAGGLAAADAACTASAQDAALSGTFQALLATSTASAASRFSTTGAPWVRVDGVPLVAQAADLFSADRTLIAPLQVTALGFYLANEGAWTGGADPQAPGDAASTCNDWTDSSANGTGTAGAVLFSAASKVYSTFGNTPCSGPIRLYCLEL